MIASVMNKTELIEIIRKLLKTDADLDFLLNLPESDLETFVVCNRWSGFLGQGTVIYKWEVALC
jgi:hypothetical protein